MNTEFVVPTEERLRRMYWRATSNYDRNRSRLVTLGGWTGRRSPNYLRIGAVELYRKAGGELSYWIPLRDGLQKLGCFDTVIINDDGGYHPYSVSNVGNTLDLIFSPIMSCPGTIHVHPPRRTMFLTKMVKEEIPVRPRTASVLELLFGEGLFLPHAPAHDEWRDRLGGLCHYSLTAVAVGEGASPMAICPRCEIPVRALRGRDVLTDPETNGLFRHGQLNRWDFE